MKMITPILTYLTSAVRNGKSECENLIQERLIFMPPKIQEPPNAPSRDELIAFVKSFPYWYQRIYLGHGVYTLDTHGIKAHHETVWQRFERILPTDLRGASVLDVGCNAGYFCIETKQRGAGRVLGIEFWGDFLRQAQAIAQIWNLDIEYRSLDAYDLPSIQEKFDLVVFTGILYHLKNPLHVLEALGQISSDAILVESEIIPDNPSNTVVVRQGPPGSVKLQPVHKGIMKFIEGTELNGDNTNWWVPDTECVLGMLRVAGYKYFSKPVLLNESRMVLAASKSADSIVNLQAL